MIGGSITDGYTTYVLEGTGNGNLAKTYYNINEITLAEGDKCISGNKETGQWKDKCNDLRVTNGSSCEVSHGQGCKRSEFSNHSSCISGEGNMKGCIESSFTGESSCSAFYNSSCQQDVFDNSTCEGIGSGACSKSTFSNKSICYAKGTGGNSGSRNCGTDSTYDNSTCYNQSTSMYGCGKATYNNGSECYSNENGGCGGGSAFNSGSKCYGNASGACGGDTYTEGSVCNANVPGSCNNNTYESGSYCAGNHCPSGTPAGDEDGAFAGHCWNGSGEHAAQYCP